MLVLTLRQRMTTDLELGHGLWSNASAAKVTLVFPVKIVVQDTTRATAVYT